VQFGRFESRARLTGSSSDLAYAESIKRLELAAYSQADLVIVVSEPERQLLVKHMPFDRIDLISNIHPLPDIVPSSQRDGKSLVFIGWGAYAPNVDAVLYFAQQVLPLILLEVPQARFLVIGRDYPPEVQSLTGPSIDLLGYVSDVSEILGTADVSVAPLRFGSGLKGKIGEALSFGIPVVSTRIGTEGFGLLPGEQVLVGDSPEAFARHSETSARRQLSEVFDKVSRIRYPLSRTAWRVWRSRIRHFWIRYVSWRIGRYF
jgi:glycosyltransferase involved in cell wall biosynthesis